MLRLFGLIVLLIGFCSVARPVCSQITIAEKQKELLGQYEQLEMVLLRMIELNRTQNPQRATVFQKVLEESKDRLILLRLNEVAVSLEQRRFSRALEVQEGLEKDLLELLDFLERGEREEQRESEKERLLQVAQELDHLLLQQRGLKRRTNESDQLLPLSQEQEELQQKVQSLADQLDVGGGKESTERGERDKRGNQDGLGSEESRKRLERAEKWMQGAQQALREDEQQRAVQEQEEAIAELQQAKGLLEKVLRQMREEEMIQTLELLDSRFRKMLQIERGIRTQTERLGREGVAQPSITTRELQMQSSRLSADQKKVIEEADVMLVLLREDGTAQALHESLLQTESDMLQVVARLDSGEWGDLTLQMEDAIIESLVEMLETVETTREEKRKQWGSDSSDQPDDSTTEEQQRLIGFLSELKMLRTMQRRINDRMIGLDQQLQKGQADPVDLETRLTELQNAQTRVERILRNIQENQSR
ncbi:MAG: hypothetical protein ACRC10_02920 [Thermoguttaceae bacterium]